MVCLHEAYLPDFKKEDIFLHPFYLGPKNLFEYNIVSPAFSLFSVSSDCLAVKKPQT